MKKLCAFFVFLFVFAGCNNPGKNFIGKWESIEHNKEKMEIVADGKIYAIKGIESGWDGHQLEISAAYENDRLVGKIYNSHEIEPGSLYYFTIRYNKKDDTITLIHWAGEDTYRRYK